MRPRPCIEPDCGVIQTHGTRCADCYRKYHRDRNQRRPWYGATWQALRKQRRGICIRCGKTGPTELDHIQPRSLAGGVRELCPPCHRKIGKSYQ